MRIETLKPRMMKEEPKRVMLQKIRLSRQDKTIIMMLGRRDQENYPKILLNGKHRGGNMVEGSRNRFHKMMFTNKT